MNAIFYCNKSEPQKVDKLLVKLAEREIILREASSIIDPVLLIELDTPVISLDGIDYTINYIYLPAFNRYYFVNNISVNRTRLWQFECHCDVLSSFKSEWKQLPAIIARNEYQYNLFLQDDRFLVNTNRFVQTMTFPNSSQLDLTGGSSYVMTIAGGASAESEATT